MGASTATCAHVLSRVCVSRSLQAPSWNAGVWLADFSQWKKLRIANDAVYWVTVAKEREVAGLPRLWKLNTQPVMYLLFHDSVKRPSQFLSHTWCVDGAYASVWFCGIDADAPSPTSQELRIARPSVQSEAPTRLPRHSLERRGEALGPQSERPRHVAAVPAEV